MRAKMRLNHVEKYPYGNEKLSFTAVCKPQYDPTGTDEDNTFAHFSPSADCSITIANPNLWGKFVAGEKYYVDFTPAAD